jgi:hypothetical protein
MRMWRRRHQFQSWVIVIDPPLLETEVIGTFPTRDEAAAFEDKHVDAPDGSRAYFVPMVTPEQYVSGE